MDTTILYKYLNNEASEAETEAVFAWIAAHPEHKREFMRLKTAWALTAATPMDAETLKADRPQLPAPVKKVALWKYAAILVLLLGSALTWYIAHTPGMSTAAPEVVLELPDAATYTLEGTASTQITTSSGEPLAKASEAQIDYSTPTAAGTAVPQHIKVPYGKTYTVVLADGTRVQLNAGSSLRFPNVFTGTTREVQLTGEGFFDVAKNAEKPFKVHAGPMTIAVLGTRFNVQAYADTQHIATTLEEGSVAIEDTQGKEALRLVPGEMAYYNTTTQALHKQQVDVAPKIAWIYGELMLDDTPSAELFKTLERHYNVQITNRYTPLEEQHFSGTLKLDADIENLLQLLQLDTAFDYRLEDRNITITKPNTIN